MSRILISLGSALLLSAALSASALASGDTTQINDQQASNQAEITQSVAAVSGDALADHDSRATSGDVWANAYALIAQKNVQIAANVDDFKLDLRR